LRKSSELTIPLDGGAETSARRYTSAGDALGAVLVLAHGAGAGQHSPFMVDFANGIADRGADVITFNFLYAEQRRGAPDRPAMLESCYRAVVARAAEMAADRALFIGGKSMGGRIATQIASADPHLPIAGLVLLGYPLHPPGQPHRMRDAHLLSITRPMLVIQGERDTFGTPDELGPIFARMKPRPALHAVPRGDHSFKLTKKDPRAQAALYTDLQRMIAEWIAVTLSETPRQARAT